LFADPPEWAAWRHHGARDGFEVVRFALRPDGLEVCGSTSAVEEGMPLAVDYTIELDSRWHTRRARVSALTARGRLRRELVGDGSGRWTVDGRTAHELDGCLDIDLESSSFTNAFPVRRLALGPGDASQAPAVYVRAFDLAVERLEQRYRRLADDGETIRFDYEAPRFDYRCELRYDASGLVLDYPGLATRV
jgi:hypothetical protein